MKIGINCGHTVDGQPGSGAIGYISEGVEVRNVGRRLMKLLRDRGVEVVDCTDDYADSTKANLAEICRLANAQPLDLFVSIHFNSGGGHGAEVFTKNGKYMEQADRVLKNLTALGFTNRGIKNRELYVINRTNVPAMLIEVCFVDSKSDCDLYNRLGADIIAQALCNAILGETEELTMAQYEELKKEIEKRDERIAALEKKVGGKDDEYDYIDENMPEWVKSDVEWMRDKQIIVGGDEGRLGLSPIKLWVIAVVARTARYLAKMMGVKM